MGRRAQAHGGGRIHERINRILFLVIVLPITGLLIYAGQVFMALSFPLGAAFGIWLVTPDVDLEATTYNEGRWLHGPLRLRPIGYILYVYYYPLALVLRHRGISHSPIFGAAIVYVYTWWLPAAILLATGWRPVWLMHPDLHVGLFVGLACGHLFHIVEDRFIRT